MHFLEKNVRYLAYLFYLIIIAARYFLGPYINGEVYFIIYIIALVGIALTAFPEGFIYMVLYMFAAVMISLLLMGYLQNRASIEIAMIASGLAPILVAEGLRAIKKAREK